MQSKKAHILIVDDEKLNLEIVSEYLDVHDYEISIAADGAIAWQMLEKSPNMFDSILLDRMMPNMTGMEVLEKIKQHPILQHCPVIFQTAKASFTDIAEGMDAGAYYYLTKPFEEEVLLSVIKTAVNDYFRFKEIQNNLKETDAIIGKLKSAEFEFQSLDQARATATFLSHACPEPENIVLGLTELMVNAIEHGNLGITYEEKSTLNSTGKWVEEVDHRLNLPENKNKIARIYFRKHDTKIEITVIDQGEGFDWKRYMDFDPDRVMDNHGRGIAVANKLSFSSVEYKGKGNEVCAQIVLD